jgi:SEC-C motif domain protein
MITYELDSLHDSFLKIRFEKGQFAGQKLHFDQFDTCGIATCNCYLLHAKEGEKEFLFDVDEQIVEAIAEEDKAYTEAIEAELTEEVWDALYEKFTFEKGLECDLVPPSEVVHNFTEIQYKEILGEGLMFFYDEVFHHAMSFKVTVDNIDYMLADAYCLVPSCDCKKIILQIITDEYETPIFTVNHDLKNKTFKLDREENVAIPYEKVEGILKEIRNQFTEAKVEGISLMNRYNRMRTVFKDFLVRKGIPQHYHPETRLVATIGRNDLCSCGSGKKYKKCCGK